MKLLLFAALIVLLNSCNKEVTEPEITCWECQEIIMMPSRTICIVDTVKKTEKEILNYQNQNSFINGNESHKMTCKKVPKCKVSRLK